MRRRDRARLRRARTSPAPFLGAAADGLRQERAASSKAAWKVIANEVMVMPAKLPDDAFAQFDCWQGYPRARVSCSAYIKDKGIKDVVFVTGDIHTFIAGDVARATWARASRSRVEFVGGSITSRGPRRERPPPARLLLGNDAQPADSTRRSSRLLRGIEPVGQTRPTSTTTATGGSRRRSSSSTVELVRMETIKRAPRRRCRPPGSGGRCSAGRRRWWPRRAPSCARARAGRARRAQAALMEVSRRLQRCSR